MSHTPGPWEVQWVEPMAEGGAGKGWVVSGAGENEWVCDCGYGGNAEDCARLIAASPDLLQALEAVEKLFATPGYYIGTREGVDPLAVDATMLLVAQAVKSAKGGA